MFQVVCYKWCFASADQQMVCYDEQCVSSGLLQVACQKISLILSKSTNMKTFFVFR